jgi:hypothetical protein
MSIQFSDDVMAEKFVGLCENVAAITEKLRDLPELKATVEKHERVYTIGKYAAVPVYGALHLGVKHLLTKIGW